MHHKIRKILKTRNENLESCRQLLLLSGFEDAEKSPISGKRMFYPKIVINATLYEYIRLVMGDSGKEVEASKFYCFLCNEEHNRGPKSSGQLLRHIKVCTLKSSPKK